METSRVESPLLQEVTELDKFIRAGKTSTRLHLSQLVFAASRFLH